MEGAIFRGGLIHIWCHTEYYCSKMVYVEFSQNKSVCVFIVMKDHVIQCNRGARCCVFIVFFDSNRALWHKQTNLSGWYSRFLEIQLQFIGFWLRQQKIEYQLDEKLTVHIQEGDTC